MRLLFALLLLPALLLPAAPSLAGGVAPPVVAARSWALYDVRAQQMLTSERADERFEPASLTKLMTAYLAFQAIARGELKRDRVVPTPPAALKAPGARMYIDASHPADVGQLLQGLIVVAANDAAIAIASAVAGNEAAFVERMNAQARRLGLANTHFSNATGEPQAQHYSTAGDMARLAAALIRDFPQEYATYAQREFAFNDLSQPSRNRLLFADPTVDGLQAGQTPASGYSLVSSAKRGDRRLVAVVVGANSDRMRNSESQRLLNTGFTRWDTMRVGDPRRAFANARVWKGETDQVALVLPGEALLAVPRGDRERIRPLVEVRKTIIAPVEAGQQLGRLRLMDGETTLTEYPLVAKKAVGEGSFFRRLVDTALLWLQ